MDFAPLQKKFARIGARLRVLEFLPGRFPGSSAIIDSGGTQLNVVKDGEGEVFEIAATRKEPPEMAVLDVRPADRHLLLLVRTAKGRKSKLLCGHDERHWFVAAIPELAPVGNVQQAKEALKPPEVQARQVRLKARHRGRRKNAAYVRQGEWFFTPADIEEPPAFLVLKNEPISRGAGSKPHCCEFLFRIGGATVYVCHRHPAGVSQEEYDGIVRADPAARRWRWQVMRRDAEVYARGRVRHPDHSALVLRGWHRVWMNTERKSRTMRHVAFLD